MLIANGLTTAFYLFRAGTVQRAFPDAPAWTPYLLAAGCAFNILLAIALFLWRKWAFYAICGMAVFMFCLNLWLGVFRSPVQVIGGFLGPAILYAVLQMGGEDKGWAHLK
jgi:hypothetical protein